MEDLKEKFNVDDKAMGFLDKALIKIIDNLNIKIK